MNREPQDIEKTVVVDHPAAEPESEPAPAGSFIQVEVMGGPMDGEIRRVAGAALGMGRSERNEMILRLDPMVSGRHARITWDDGQYWIEDLDSRNGVYFGEKRMEGRAPIAPGTQFILGRTRLEFATR